VFAQCPVRLFSVATWCCAFYVLCSGIFFNDFESVPIDPLITGINLVVHSIYFCFCFPFSFSRNHIYITEIPVIIDRHVPFSLSRIMMFLLWRIFLSVFTHSFLKMISIPSWLFSTWFDTCSERRFLLNSNHISFHTSVVGHTAYHVAFCMLLHQYWTGWRNLVYCLPIFLTSAFAIYL
jgi:hypothetical protein